MSASTQGLISWATRMSRPFAEDCRDMENGRLAVCLARVIGFARTKPMIFAKFPRQNLDAYHPPPKEINMPSAQRTTIAMPSVVTSVLIGP
jgi:hypothetical protein